MGNLKKFFSLIGSILSWTEEAFLCLLLFSMILLACVQIFLRIFYSSGILWADPLLRYMVIWVGLFSTGKNSALAPCPHKFLICRCMYSPHLCCSHFCTRRGSLWWQGYTRHSIMVPQPGLSHCFWYYCRPLPYPVM